jgi:hypothetical protein
MASPSSPPNAHNRNTLNQRLCRARRKDYITDLERRVREYEARDVQATTEVQNAARAVADENRVLREEVRTLRQRNLVLEGLLAKADAETEARSMVDKVIVEEERRGPSPRGRGIADLKSVGRPLRVRESVAGGQYPSPPRDIDRIRGGTIQLHRTGNSTSGAVEDVHVQHMPERQQQPSPTSRPPSEPISTNTEHERTPTKAEDNMQPATLPSPHNSISASSSPGDHPPIHSPNSTPCEQAAMIIASMRGLQSTDSTINTDILPALGCQTPESARSCAVDNIRLFGILDDERG